MAVLSGEAAVAFLLALGLVTASASQGFPETLSLLAGEAPYAIGETCDQHLQLYQNSMGTELWAMQMLDSWTKFPSGLLYGALMDLGNYDECLSVKNIPSPAGVFGGKYCLVSVFPTPEDTQHAESVVKAVKDMLPSVGHAGGEGVVPMSMPASAGVSLMGAVCLPSSCSSMDFMTYLNVNFSRTLEIYHLPKLSFYTEEILCHNGKFDAFRPIDWVAAVFLIIFALFAITSTAYDLLTQKSDTRRELFLAFSWYSNGKKLLSTQKSSQDISCLHGIRVLSMAWVVMSHRYSLAFAFPSINAPAYSKQVAENWGYIFLHGGTLSVDTFFLLSGVLLAYVFLNSVHRGAKFNILIFYLHRYIRLTPALAVIIFLYESLIKYTGDGPMWTFDSLCKNQWWRHLLYINNYWTVEEPCISQAWYLACDMQLYWLSPLVLIPLWKKPKVGKALLGLFTLAGLAICFGICYHYEILTFMRASIVGDTERANDYSLYYYYSTHTRFTPWLVGIAFGYILHEIKKLHSGRITLSMVQRFALWCFAAFFMLVALCGTFPLDQIDHEFNVTEFTFFNTFHRPVWVLGIGLMILACSTGYGGPVNAFLSWSFFLPLSRLTYGIFLIHIIMQNIISLPLRTPIYINDLTLICETATDLVLTALFAIVFCLLFESPFIVLEKVILGFFGVGRSSNKTKSPVDKATHLTAEKQQDLEAAPVKDKEPEDLHPHNGAANEVNTVEYGAEEYKGDSLKRRKTVDFSSTANLLPH